MIESKKYDRNFFSELEENSYKSAIGVIPVIAEFFNPKSVIDVGCGTGAWLKAWMEKLSLENFLGIDGPYVDKERLLIPADKFSFRDLKEPINVDRKFDIAMSLEVGEHLP